MSRVRTDSSAGAAGFAAAPEAAAMPVPVDGHVPIAPNRMVPGAGTIVRSVVRALRYAAVAVALMTTVPIGLVAVNGHRLLSENNMQFYIRNNAGSVDALRPFGLPTDPSITPLAAGKAFAAIQPVKQSPGFVPRPAPVLDASWRDTPLAPELFLAARPDLTRFPSARGILAMAEKGFTPAEMSYLRTIATAPAWREFDIVARAKAVDILGGQFEIPFGPDAYQEFRPMSYKAVREMADASVSRAAYQLALGQRDSAEAALRATISVGFAVIDNGSAAFDGMFGSMIVGMGREGLRRYYAATGDPRFSLEVLVRGPRNQIPEKPSFPPDETRRMLAARVANPRLPRGERLESLNMFSYSSCTSVPELLTGPRPDVAQAFRVARRDLARYPSERSLIDVMERTLQPSIDQVSTNPFTYLAVSASTVPGVVLHNPRLAACARLLAW
jgi:hypothetical protein